MEMKKMQKTRVKAGMLSVTLLLTSWSTMVMAAPPTELERGNFAIGVATGDHTNDYYIENKLGDTFTLGAEHVQWRSGDGETTTDIYGKIDMKTDMESDENAVKWQLILGRRAFSDSGKKYIGAGASANIGDNWKAYSSIIAGQNFEEVEAGFLYPINEQSNLNISYRNCRHNGAHDDVYIGVAVKI